MSTEIMRYFILFYFRIKISKSLKIFTLLELMSNVLY